MEETGAGEVRHWNADVNGISLHVAERGPAACPAVLLIHGFPELWLSWRHQMAVLAARGFRAIVPDLRGYGDSDAPADPAAYSIFHIVGDIVALLDHLGLPKVFVVGHDWGAMVAWHLCLFRPDRVRAVVNLGVPYFSRGPRSMTESFAAIGDSFYIVQFQEPGRAERAFGRYDVATVLKKFYSMEIDELIAPPGVEIIDFLEAPSSPIPWITDEELGQYAEKFQKSGFTGPLNYYRMLDTNWILTAPWNALTPRAQNRRRDMEAVASNPKRIALVTGGNKGVGLETCRQLANKGLRVVLTARNEARGLEAVEAIRGSGGDAEVFFHQLDVTDTVSVARLASSIRDQFGRLDILINNAAIPGVDRDAVTAAEAKDQVEGMDVNQIFEWMRQVTRETYEEAKECIRTNYYGAKLVTEALFPLLQLSSSGRIVNVSSGFGLLKHFSGEELRKEFDDVDNLTEERLDELLDLFLEDFNANLLEARGWPTSGYAAYKVAKASLNAYTRIIAKKYPAMRINCVTPGFVKTDMAMHTGFLTPEEGASNPVKVALLPDDGPTGAYFDRNGVASFV